MAGIPAQAAGAGITQEQNMVYQSEAQVNVRYWAASTAFYGSIQPEMRAPIGDRAQSAEHRVGIPLRWI